MRETGRRVALIIGMVFLFLIPTAYSQVSDSPPATVLQSIQNKVDAVTVKQEVIINSINDFKFQMHEDLNGFITIEQFDAYKAEMNQKLDSKPDFSTILIATIIVGALYFLLFLLFKGQGKM